ncbi:hypothetical protein HD806DRAFT_532587 [Xylariaceae sp. AK1471]|nr:hypothetical protein HD806DRAFT_532587 [Xylariaceae sp. AK1471]
MEAIEYKLVFFVPHENQTSGTSEFHPRDTENLHLGKVSALEKVDDIPVETLCVGLETARKAVGALIKYGCLEFSLRLPDLCWFKVNSGASLRRAWVRGLQD